MSGPPSTPTVEPSEPEKERMVAEEAVRSIQNGEFEKVQVCLQFSKDFLDAHGLTTDGNGFIIRQETGEYATPYVFVEDLARKRTKDRSESMIDAFFRPTTDDRVHGWGRERIHLSDLHTVVETDGGVSHPVPDSPFQLRDLYATLESRFQVVTSWSDTANSPRFKADDETTIQFACASEGNEVELTCMNLSCNYTGPLQSWEGDLRKSPKCPDCGGLWDGSDSSNDDVTVCVLCGCWYWGDYYSGKSVYAEPCCPRCLADMEYLEYVSRYGEYDSYVELVNDNRPEFIVVTVTGEGGIRTVLEAAETWEDAAKKQTDISEFSSAPVAILPLDRVNQVDYYEWEYDDDVYETDVSGESADT